MNSQQELFEPLKPVDTKQFTTIQSRFEEFHRLNPGVYRKLVELALTLRKKGFKAIGMKMLWETLRWYYMHEIGPMHGATGYQLNNVFTSRYARLIMATESELAGVFETRKLKAK